MTVANLSGWRRLLTLEPALVRGVIVAVGTLLAVWGVDAADLLAKVDETALVIFAVAPLIATWWTRSKVTPTVAVAAEEDRKTGVIVAGPAGAPANGTPVTLVAQNAGLGL